MNKVDLISQAKFTQREAESISREQKMKLYLTSVKEDLNVGVVFQHLAEDFVKRMTLESRKEKYKARQRIGQCRPRPEYPLWPSGGLAVKVSEGSSVRHSSATPGETLSRGVRYMIPKYSYYYDPYSNYLSNPMFNSISGGPQQHHSSRENTFALKPGKLKKGGEIKSSCKMI